MSFDLTDLLAAFALLLVIEGILPFVNPSGLKRTLARLAEVGDRELRVAGLASMLVGLLLLTFAR